MKIMLCIVILGAAMLLLGVAPARAQTATPTATPAPLTAGIPGSVTLQLGQTVTFSNSSQSLAVQFQPYTVGSYQSAMSAVVSFDGQAVTIDASQALANIPPSLSFSGTTGLSCTLLNGLTSVERCPITSGQLAFSAPMIVCIGGDHCPVTVHYPAGWNLLAVTRNTHIDTNVGPIYILQAGDTAFESTTDGAALSPDEGYWVYFDRQTDVALQSTYAPFQPPPVMINLPAGQYVMIGNPFSVPAAISGPGTALTHDSMYGYQLATELQSGQGAFAYFAAGGTLTLTPLTLITPGQP